MMTLMINKIAFYSVHAPPFMHPTPIFKETYMYFHGIKQIIFLRTQNTINVTIIKNAVYSVYVISSFVLDSFRLYM